ncbi:ATP-binding protein [Anabaena sp. AL93]|uniref:ATP-binding protein n=1 Tax=Anabaena sp. AL93 TaxID=1678133 RepID=UPI0007FD53DA|nr:ATP-binding protein [Anabaena sp. AL93]OBQ18468.1 MAG: hypothetical protein AN486_12005 [Anabaena sp. AL93]
MDAKQIIRGLKDWVKREKAIDLNLSDCQEAILEYSLQNIAYANMENLGYAVDTIKNNTGPELFQYLSQVTGRTVSKKNCLVTLSRLLEHLGGEKDPEHNSLRLDLLEAPNLQDFYGREQELSQLETWIVTESRALLGVFGIPGIGKTQLLRKFVDQVKDKFDYVIWKDLTYCPLLADFLTDIESYFSARRNIPLPQIRQRIISLIPFLNQHRCLLIFDHCEQLIETDEISADQQKINYSNYGLFLKSVSELEHQSCVVFVGLEKHRQMDIADKSRFRELTVAGLKTQDAQYYQYLLDNFQLSGQGIGTLIKKYQGHPLALKLAAPYINEHHQGKIDEFLEGTLFIHNAITEIFDKHLLRLSNTEINIVRKLAYETEPISLPELYRFFPSISQTEIRQSMHRLCTTGLVENNDSQNLVTFGLFHPLLTKYIKNRFPEI